VNFIADYSQTVSDGAAANTSTNELNERVENSLLLQQAHIDVDKPKIAQVGYGTVR
jgi:hypothetical protein